MVPLAILGILLFIFIGGEVVLHLWNWLLPPLFGWRLITFWQAVGILALCRILFGGGPPEREKSQPCDGIRGGEAIRDFQIDR
jgi:hypothetical protein